MSKQLSESVVSLKDVEVHFTNEGGITDAFSESETVKAVDGVSLDIYENDVIALVGESGCGKTTLGKVAIGAQEPTSGSVSYRSQDIWEAKKQLPILNHFQNDIEIPFDEIRRSLQIIHQDPGSSLNPNKKVISILSDPMKEIEGNLDFEARRARILGLIERVGMTPPEDYVDRYPHQLSGGEKQRIALIRALLMNPDLVLADEPISAVDVSLRIELMDLMHELQDVVDTSFLFISHDLSNARYLAEKVDGRIGIMYLGKLVEIGPAEQIIDNPRHPYTKALKWATPTLRTNASNDDIPLRGIDIPDPVNPPSGCRFHTRCPKAREVCKHSSPQLLTDEEKHQHFTACFRDRAEHEYWDSDPIESD